MKLEELRQYTPEPERSPSTFEYSTLCGTCACVLPFHMPGCPEDLKGHLRPNGTPIPASGLTIKDIQQAETLNKLDAVLKGRDLPHVPKSIAEGSTLNISPSESLSPVTNYKSGVGDVVSYKMCPYRLSLRPVANNSPIGKTVRCHRSSLPVSIKNVLKEWRCDCGERTCSEVHPVVVETILSRGNPMIVVELGGEPPQRLGITFAHPVQVSIRHGQEVKRRATHCRLWKLAPDYNVKDGSGTPPLLVADALAKTYFRDTFTNAAGRVKALEMALALLYPGLEQSILIPSPVLVSNRTNRIKVWAAYRAAAKLPNQKRVLPAREQAGV